MASTHAHSGDDDDVAIVSTSTPDERNAEKRKHAIDLEAEDPKRAKTPSVELETRVAELRSVLKPAMAIRSFFSRENCAKRRTC